MSRKMIQIATPCAGEEEWQAVRDPIMSGWLTQGPRVREFEQAFAEMHKVETALAVTSCTTGLHLALASLGVGPGDEVIVPSFTWIATANVVLYCGAEPVFVDVDTATFNISIEQALSKVTERTKAVIPVHLFGLCADIGALRAGLPDHVAILEDAACAAGAMQGDKFAGGLGDIAAFSFHPRKSITTGEGGMVTTNDTALGELADKLRNHGAGISEEQRHHGPRPYLLPDFALLGYNYRMSDLQGAVGAVQLTKLERFITERAKWAAFYREQLGDLPWLATPDEPENGRHAWQSFVTMVDPDTAPKPRNDIMGILQEKDVSTRPGTHAVHMLSYYRDRYAFKSEDFPAARYCNDNSMAIPLHNAMTEEDFQYVVECLHEI